MIQRGRILIVDDEANALTALAELLRDEGFQVETAADGYKALAKLQEFGPDLLLTDLEVPELSGLELMRCAREGDPEIAAVVMAASSAIDTAVAAMRQGAADYLTKPINVDELLIVMERVLERRRLNRESGILRQRLSERHRIHNIVGSCAAMQRVLETVVQVAPSRASVLITGESGTGKELIAAAIHEHSPRSGGPFVKLHCAALADSLIESELFGHERGAFTGAAGRRDGRFHQADCGTLFLDEIGDLPASTQIKLLRFLQEREFERVGGNQTIKVDVRIVAATNRDLAQLVREGKFREDLYYRLNVVSIEVPPLRARSSDIPLLANHFLLTYTAENGKTIRGFSPEALAGIVHHDWPGNVRELENAVERAAVVSRSEEIQIEDLAPSISSVGAHESADDQIPQVPGATLADLEKYAILKTLEHTGGSTSRAAQMLGISPRKIQYRLRDYSGRGPRGPGSAVGSSTSNGSSKPNGAREGESFGAAAAGGSDPMK